MDNTIKKRSKKDLFENNFKNSKMKPNLNETADEKEFVIKTFNDSFNKNNTAR